MKKTLLIASLLAFVASAVAQGISPYSVRNFRFAMEINSDIWQNKPDNLKVKNINRGFNVALLYHHRFGESKFGFSSGLMLATQNMYLKNSILSTDEDGVSVFSELPGNTSFNRNKLNMNFLEVPVEFSFKTKGQMTMALGARAGYLISDKTKYKGQDFAGNPQRDIKIKEFNHGNLLDYRLGVYGVVGYRWINLSVYYGLTNLFEKDQGPEMSPITIGILVRPY